MSAIDMEMAIKMHIEKFGVEPIFTGIYWNMHDEVLVSLVESIEAGVPYVEPDLSEIQNA